MIFGFIVFGVTVCCLLLLLVLFSFDAYFCVSFSNIKCKLIKYFVFFVVVGRVLYVSISILNFRICMRKCSKLTTFISCVLVRFVILIGKANICFPFRFGSKRKKQKKNVSVWLMFYAIRFYEMQNS